MSWEAVIGLEIHVQLATQSKIFSGAATTYGAEPNAQACAVDLGLPGVLPVLNETAVEMAVKFGLAIGAEINLHSIFDRKNYFYPDLPKGYQISQFATPIVGQGEIKLDLADGSQRVIGITRAHLEEDAGKSVHDLFPGQTGIDLNRTGTPLLEVVSEPDLRSASEAAEYFRQMHSLVKYLGICDGNLAEGSMRCDANVSVRPHGQEAFGERTEIKNINSFRFVERAIELEIERQIDVLEAGGTIHRETRLFDADADETRSMRSKELSEDYRYFPDPDLLPLHISSAFVQAVRDSLPELPDARCQRYQEAMGLSAYDAASLSNDLDRAEFFEAVVSVCNNPKLSANWLNGELSAYLNNADLEIAASPVTAGQLGQLIQRIDDETLSSKTAKELFKALWAQADTESNVDALIEQLGLKQMNDDGELSAIVSGVLEANPDQVAELKSGKDKVLGFLVGQVMKATGGKANPKQVNELIRKSL
ncbi:MAG TPA: Asp-tRNA(Asn)/Glu-tRNA(Gln) amidotransferase GatCAB subunit B [Gammaproteobacteria bacterium]|nr:Asp-tRNA(Asn)/Glu-tRNA(Gln) amidotransferase GatCAB subunit B [Gammaproteobacteria bacterium]|tara:strand:- start:3997 stop:5433 length:1437 start_codon:yes stop_codon:yes gene_type:complete